MMGYSKVEAGNIIAKIIGLGTSKTGWTVKELQSMLFLQYLDDIVPP
jgi:hypothetical protein